MSYCTQELQSVLKLYKMPNKEAIFRQLSHVSIYGAGATGKRVLGFLRKKGVNVAAFLDEKSENKFVDEIPVMRLDDLRVSKETTIILALFNHRDDVVPLIESLKRRGFSRLIPYTELFMHFSDEFTRQYWLASPKVYESNASKLSEVYSLLADQTSRDLFLSTLKFRLTGDPRFMSTPDVKNIYFPGDIPGEKKPEHFVDCGAFDGDTLSSIKKRFGMIKSIRAFEPDQENYKKLQSLSQSSLFSEDTLLIPYGVWSSSCEVNFSSGGSASSAVLESGENKIECISLDEYLVDYQPTLIKMDIEGSEFEALKGSQKIIASYHPDLAISIYHVPEHLWEIPLFISQIASGYQYYLRSHGANGYDTVLYARYSGEDSQ